MPLETREVVALLLALAARGLDLRLDAQVNRVHVTPETGAVKELSLAVFTRRPFVRNFALVSDAHVTPETGSVVEGFVAFLTNVLPVCGLPAIVDKVYVSPKT